LSCKYNRAVQLTLLMQIICEGNISWLCGNKYQKHRSPQWRSQPKNFGGAKMFERRRIRPFCLEKRHSKGKMTIFSKNLRGMASLVPLATPMVLFVPLRKMIFQVLIAHVWLSTLAVNSKKHCLFYTNVPGLPAAMCSRSTP